MKIDSSQCDLLTQYLKMQNIMINKDELLYCCSKINNEEDCICIENNVESKLWFIIPHLLLQLGQNNKPNNPLFYFKNFKPVYTLNKSFIFINPLNRHIKNKLLDSLPSYLILDKEIKLQLTPEVINSLYGGHRWYLPYLLTNQVLNTIGKEGIILIFKNVSAHYLLELNNYKNKHRTDFSSPIRVDKSLLNTDMDGVINSFHCPDIVENVRQMLCLGLIKESEVKYHDKEYWE